MNSKNQAVELIVNQGKNVLESMRDLKRSAKKKGKSRSDLYERYCANLHSFSVYTYMDASIGQSKEVQEFQQILVLFSECFSDTRTNYEAEVDVKHIETVYEDVFPVYNEMVSVLGFNNELVNIKGF